MQNDLFIIIHWTKNTCNIRSCAKKDTKLYLSPCTAIVMWKALHTSAITETSTISCSITLHGFEFFYSQLKKLSFVKKICKRWIVAGYEKKINVGYYK